MKKVKREHTTLKKKLAYNNNKLNIKKNRIKKEKKERKTIKKDNL
jgi:hypothetical protein